MNIKRVVCWVSAGAASAVAAKMAQKEWGDKCVFVYQDTGSEHPDNKRFLKNLESWYGQKILRIGSKDFKDTWEVFEKTRYLVGPTGARCTGELKKKVALAFIEFADLEIFGYTLEEQKRVDLFIKQNFERNASFPLIESQLKKEDCLAIIERAGIDLPVMYKLGFKNNNCIGCVKGAAGYWNHVRKHFPEVFERMSKVERSLNVAINKTARPPKKGEKPGKNGLVRERVFLDELDPDAGNMMTEPAISCGLFCAMAENDLSGQ